MTPTKVLRTVLCVTVVVAVLLFSAGCSKTYKTDYLKKYSSYLDYSLGADNWKLVDSQQDKVEFADFVYYYTWWSVDYKDSEGVERTLMFNNYTGSTPDDMHFMNAVIRAAAEISRDRIDKSIAPLYKGEGTEPNLTILISDYPLYAPENRDLSYSKPGVSTSDIPKLSDLDTAWIFQSNRFYLELVGTFDDEVLYSQAVASLYSEIQAFTEADPIVLLDISLRDASTNTIVQSTQIAYIGGQANTPEPGESQTVKSWFEDLLRATYFADLSQ